MSTAYAKPESICSDSTRWVHWVAWLLCGTTFPLLWVGGLVTTTKSGMSVPDWPGTYGYNLFLYPYSTWWSGPWDLFVEHGHRLLATVVGLLSIVLAVLIYRYDQRIWLKQMGVLAVVGVVLQGTLGGLRVVLDDRILAMIHGTVGPIFFALTVALVLWTSRDWKSLDAGTGTADGGNVERLYRLVVVTWGLILLQMMVGALLRHMPTTFVTTAFTHATRTHVVLAVVIALLVIWILRRTMREGVPVSLRTCGWVVGLVVQAQIVLGLTSWILKYGTPLWARNLLPASQQAILAEGWWQSHMVTAHQATGSALLGTTTILALVAWRISQTTAGETHGDSLGWVVSQTGRGENMQ